MEFAGLGPSAIRKFIDTHFSSQVSLLLERALEEGTYIREAAEGIARDRFARMREGSGDRSLRKKAFSSALGLYRDGLIPSFLVGTLAGRYFQKRMEGRF